MILLRALLVHRWLMATARLIVYGRCERLKYKNSLKKLVNLLGHPYADTLALGRFIVFLQKRHLFAGRNSHTRILEIGKDINKWSLLPEINRWLVAKVFIEASSRFG